MPRSSAVRKQTLVDAIPNIYSDEELAGMCKDPSRKEWAFTLLHSRWRERLIRFFQKKIGDSARSEDLVQETFLRVSDHIEHFDCEKKFSPWIYTIAGRLVSNEWRNRKCSPILYYGQVQGSCPEDFSFESVDPKADASRLAEEKSFNAKLKKEIRKLPPHMQLIFTMRDIDGKTYKEIAEEEHLSLGTVKSRVNRARSAMRDGLGRNN